MGEQQASTSTHINRAITKMTQQEFEHIAPEARRIMLGVGRHFFGNDMDAEDVAQDGLLQLWRYCEQLDENHNWPALATRIAKHCCVDIARRRRITIPIADDAAQSFAPPGASLHPSPHEEMEKHELKQALRDAIRHLPPAERRLFQLRQLDGLSLDEISEQEHIAKPSAKSMISAARRKLFEAMKAHTDQLSPKKRKP